MPSYADISSGINLIVIGPVFRSPTYGRIILAAVVDAAPTVGIGNPDISSSGAFLSTTIDTS